jgi:hypothetical protein
MVTVNTAPVINLVGHRIAATLRRHTCMSLLRSP